MEITSIWIFHNMATLKIETPAGRAMRLLSAKRIAYACDLTTNAVWKWETSGGGRIPSRHLATVLDLARQMGVDLPATDLIEARGAA
ncbi:hypothetical protein SH203_02860 [Brevundimonas sp. SH203]|nr:hypothetical protein SH203_02860 [Brevundimonas sp. SH203]